MSLRNSKFRSPELTAQGNYFKEVIMRITIGEIVEYLTELGYDDERIARIVNLYIDCQEATGI